MSAIAQSTEHIRTPDQRLRVFVSSTLKDLSPEREAVRAAVDGLRFTPVMFELGARPHAPRDLYRAYLAQSDLFVGVYWQAYGWVAPGETASGLEDEYTRSAPLPRLVYVKSPASDRDPRLTQLLARIRDDDLASYKSFSTSEELRRLVKDDIALLLSERFGAARSQEPAPPKAAVARPLPMPLTGVVGRRREADMVERLVLGDGVRLVTLTGPGGVGKSRLALDVVTRLGPSFPDGVALAGLASVATPDRVPAALATALGVQTAGGRTTIEDVKSYLRDRRLLLVIDNLEHVSKAAPLVTELLAAAPGLTVITTSRTLLRLRGEQELPVPPLSTPPEGDRDVESLKGFEAVRLFVQRAQAADLRFALTAENAPAVAEISRRLDGLPLALELAAARVRLLPVQTLLERLDGGLDLSTRGARDLPARQRTLRDAIAWSFDLLRPHERSYLTRLAVFAGGFDLEAAEAAFADPPDPAAGLQESPDALEALATLVDSSLVQQEERNGRARFSLLETIREYARERLLESATSQEALDHHACHFLSLAQAAGSELSGPGLVAWLDRLDIERDNLRAALSRLLDQHEADSAVRLVWGVWRYWWLRGHLEEGVQWTERILADRGSLSPPSLGLALSAAAAMALGNRDFAAAERFAEESLPLLVAAGDRRGRMVPTAVLGQIASARGDVGRGRDLLEVGVDLARETGDDWGIAIQLSFLGQNHLGQSEDERATPLFAEALDTSRRLGDRFLILLSLYNLAQSRQSDGDLAGATDLLEEGLQLAAATGDDPSLAHFLEALAALAARHLDVQRAGCLAGAADTLQQDGGSVWLLATASRPPEPSAELRAVMATAVFAEAKARGRALGRRAATCA